MRTTVNYSQFAEVLVERDDDLAAFVCATKNDLVARVAWPIGNALDVVTGLRQRRADRAGDATVEKYLHALVPVTAGSTRSWPTSRQA